MLENTIDFLGYIIPNLTAEYVMSKKAPKALTDYYKNIVLSLLQERYFLKDECTEEELFRRVANFVGKTDEEKEIYFQLMKHRLFMPATPTLMNAGRRKPMMSSCFVINPDDDMVSIGEYWKTMALVQQHGGGVGVDWTKIRPEGSVVRGTDGVASGWFPFFEVASAVNKAIKQGSVRSGANAATLALKHPEIMKFIDIKKENPAKYGFFNLSVTVTDEEFMQLLNDELITTEFDGVQYTEKKSWICDGKEKFYETQFKGLDFIRHMAENAWKTGDPSFYFVDRINEFWDELGMRERINPVGQPYGKKIAHNPCGEQGLTSHSACNLASINLYAMINPATGTFHFELMEYVTKWATRFLDGVIDKNWFPDERITKTVHDLRNIGLGFMGLADVFYLKGWEYGSRESIKFSESISKNLTEWAKEESVKMAYEYGPAPVLIQSPPIMLRNTDLTCIAPTGSISLLALCSSGIEPWFYHEYEKLVYPKGTKQQEKYIKVKYPAAIMFEREKQKTSTELTAIQHIDILAAVSKNVTNAVSKTVNLPEETTVDEIINLYRYAFKSGCKSFTVFRNNSRSDLAIKAVEHKEPILVVSDYATGEQMKELKKYWTEKNENSTIVKYTSQSTNGRINPCPNCDEGEIVMMNGCKGCNLSCGFEACMLG